jgi:hypothetical protein
MKKLLMTLALGAVLAGPAAACEGFGQLAEELMIARQMGVPMSRVMEVAEAGWGDEDVDLLRQMVVMAYEVPRYATDEYQRRAVADYRNEVELACYQALR